MIQRIIKHIIQKRYYMLLGLAVVSLSSCSILKGNSEDGFYNSRNALKVKSKDGLFSSLHVSFGGYATGNKEKDVNGHIISFKDQRSPFHFSLKDGDGNAASVQAVITGIKDLQNKNLPALMVGEDHQDIFYAWIGGVNTLRNWELMVRKPTADELSHQDQVGIFRSVDEIFSVHGNNRFMKAGSSEDMSYEFRLKGVTVAAVRINGDQKVWLDKQLNRKTRFALAGAIASLLMK